jgi:hypothetical protein
LIGVSNTLLGSPLVADCVLFARVIGPSPRCPTVSTSEVNYQVANMALLSPHIYWMIPIFSGFVWLGMLLGMLLWWSVEKHSPHLTPMAENQKIA